MVVFFCKTVATHIISDAKMEALATDIGWDFLPFVCNIATSSFLYDEYHTQAKYYHG